MKKLLMKCMAFMPLLLLIIATNYIYDPANIFKEGYEKNIVILINEDKNIENLNNYDERLLQKYYIEMLKKPKDVVILGSSRSMQINSGMLHNSNVFNSSVSGAVLEDYMAIYQLYKKQGMLPKKLIIGIDPWIFNKNNGEKRWTSLSQNYNELAISINEYGGKESSFAKLSDNKYFQLMSLPYFQQSAKTALRKKEDYRVTSLSESDNMIKLSDGSISYGKETREITPQEVDEEVGNLIAQKNLYKLDGYKKLDINYQRKFEKFLDLILADKVEVTLFLSPYHPIMYDYIDNTADYAIVEEVEQYLLNVADIRGIVVIGSYDPMNMRKGYKFTSDYFYDSLHIRPEALEILFSGAAPKN